MKAYFDLEELKERLGYKVYKPKIGNLGKALFRAIKKHKLRKGTEKR